ncbi:MAG: TolB family protein [Chloroflexota bacterium]
MNFRAASVAGRQRSWPLLLMVLMLLAAGARGDDGEPGVETGTPPQASPTQQPTPTKAKGRLAFVAGDDNTWDVYALDVKGGVPTRLTEGLLAQWPCWSPDGSKMAFMDMAD